jgi:hypothetical protein
VQRPRVCLQLTWLTWRPCLCQFASGLLLQTVYLSTKLSHSPHYCGISPAASILRTDGSGETCWDSPSFFPGTDFRRVILYRRANTIVMGHFKRIRLIDVTRRTKESVSGTFVRYPLLFSPSSHHHRAITALASSSSTPGVRKQAFRSC